MRWYCTYCDRNYLVRLLALNSSLTRHEQEPFTLFVVCLDELTRTILNHLSLPNISTIGLHELEIKDPLLRQARSSRTLVEYYWTLTPTVILYLFEQHPQIERLTYLDADLFFYSSPEPMFSEAPDASVLIHGHRFAEKYKELEAFGTYNVGLLSFIKNAEAFSILHEWREQCLNWCYASLEDGKFGDQLYLNDWPQRFAGVHVLQHPGIGAAPWNQNDITFETAATGKLLADGYPLIFYHFHSLGILTTDLYVPSKHEHYCFEVPVLLLCHIPYLAELRRQQLILQEILPGFHCGSVSPQGAIVHTLLATLPCAQLLSQRVETLTRINLTDGWVLCRLDTADQTSCDVGQLTI